MKVDRKSVIPFHDLAPVGSPYLDVQDFDMSKNLKHSSGAPQERVMTVLWVF